VAVKVDSSVAQACLAKWQPLLRLSDWDIRVEIVPGPWRKSGDIQIDADDRKALLLLNEDPPSENLEETVVHELLHLKIWGLDQMVEDLIRLLYGEEEGDPRREFAYTQFMTTLESTVEDLTKGFLAATCSPTPLSFGRLRNMGTVETRPGREGPPGPGEA
jgi:hypothetical protein